MSRLMYYVLSPSSLFVKLFLRCAFEKTALLPSRLVTSRVAVGMLSSPACD